MNGKQKNCHKYRAYLLLMLVLAGMLTFTACEDPMESEIMQNPTFIKLLMIFGYEPEEEVPEIWGMPCEYTRVSSPFGYRDHPVSGEWKLHTGIDLAAPKDTPIYASRAGKVVYAGNSNSSSGIYVSIDHGDGYKSQYLHMNSFVVKSGQTVEKGELIGYVGKTGTATGYHLHFTIRQYDLETEKWDPVDPAEYIDF